MNNLNDKILKTEKKLDLFEGHEFEAILSVVIAFFGAVMWLGPGFDIFGKSLICIGVFSIISGIIGQNRKIGFRKAYIIGAILPVVGLVIALVSPKN